MAAMTTLPILCPACAPPRRTAPWAGAAWAALLTLATPAIGQGEGPGVLPPQLGEELQQMVGSAAGALWGDAARQMRVEVQVGQLDPRLRLAPCQRIEPYLPPGTRPLGQTRVGLRCTEGRTHWNVYLPVTVKLWGRALAARSPLPAGTVLGPEHLATAEVDLAASNDPAVADEGRALGRTLARSLAPGDALRQGDLKTRQFFPAGEVVRVTALGNGYAISSEGTALGPGIEGQSVRVRTESGRIVTGAAIGARDVEIKL